MELGIELPPSMCRTWVVSSHTKSNKTSKNQGVAGECWSMPVIIATERWRQEAWRPPWTTGDLASNKQTKN